MCARIPPYATGLPSSPKLRLDRRPKEGSDLIMSSLDEPRVDPVVDQLEEPVAGAASTRGPLEGSPRGLSAARLERWEGERWRPFFQES